MKSALLLLLFTVSLALPAWARLGETGDMAVARYGQPLSEFDQKAEGDKIPMIKLTFQKNGFQIEVSVAGGYSVAESFRKISGDALTLDEARTLLTNNAQGFKWSAPVMVDGERRWMRDDGAMARLSDGRTLYLVTKQLMDAEMKAKSVQRAPTLEGF